jgi:hypothetical protein
MEQCEVSVTIPLNQTKLWMATVISIELDNTVEQTTQVTLTSLCGSHLGDTTAMPIALFPVHYQGDPMWQQRLVWTVIQQRLCMAAYEGCHIAISRELV